MARFSDKVVIVTGGTSGIGRAACIRFAQEGALVMVAGRNEEEGAEVVGTITHSGGQAFFVQVDVGEVEQVKACVDQVVSKHGRVDVLVNNAAMMTFDTIIDLKVEDWDQLQAVNMRSVFLFCKYCLPHMKGGAIVNISSVHAHQTTPNVVPYAVSKGGMEAFTRGLSREIDASHARVNAIAPGAVDTPMLWNNPNLKSGKEKLEGPIGKPEDLAAAICFLASDEANYINGTTLTVDGGRLATL